MAELYQQLKKNKIKGTNKKADFNFHDITLYFSENESLMFDIHESRKFGLPPVNLYPQPSNFGLIPHPLDELNWLQ